ncbi:MAG: hypothetical protein ABI361_07210 [Nitrososphaera sp.]|jgi:hypothetical protein
MADPNRHIRKKKLRDLHDQIYKVRLRMHNRKAKRSIPKLQAKLVALEKAVNEVSRGNFQHLPKRTPTPRVCQACNGPISLKGYHICKPGAQWRKH